MATVPERVNAFITAHDPACDTCIQHELGLPQHNQVQQIQLLRTFIEAGAIGHEGSRVTEAGVMWQTIIHMAFIASAIGIAWVDRMTQQRN